MPTSALVLNASYEPLCVVSARRAAVLVLTDKAVPVTTGDGLLRSQRYCIPEPSVVRLNRFIKVPYYRPVAPTRRAIMARDRGKCVYCGRSASTIDHVVPRSRGGRHVWDNVVAACDRCNHVKADRTLAELGWRLPREPAVPGGTVWRLLGHRKPEPAWLTWLGVVPEPAR